MCKARKILKDEFECLLKNATQGNNTDGWEIFIAPGFGNIPTIMFKSADQFVIIEGKLENIKKINDDIKDGLTVDQVFRTYKINQL